MMGWWIWLHGVATGAGLLAIVVHEMRQRRALGAVASEIVALPFTVKVPCQGCDGKFASCAGCNGSGMRTAQRELLGG